MKVRIILEIVLQCYSDIPFGVYSQRIPYSTIEILAYLRSSLLCLQLLGHGNSLGAQQLMNEQSKYSTCCTHKINSIVKKTEIMKFVTK